VPAELRDRSIESAEHRVQTLNLCRAEPTHSIVARVQAVDELGDERNCTSSFVEAHRVSVVSDDGDHHVVDPKVAHPRLDRIQERRTHTLTANLRQDASVASSANGSTTLDDAAKPSPERTGTNPPLRSPD
jgi:hypothetical protein